MKHWFNNNYKTLIIAAFLIPIITVAIVSISHVTKWYGISNPVTWSVYLSIGIEIAALSALAAISANMGKKVYFPFAIVTLIQFIGNIFFAYTYININSQEFRDWVDLVSPLTELLGVDPTDLVGNKRFLAFFAGGMLPIISLSFLHMLVKFTEEDRSKEEVLPQSPEQLKDFVDETTRIHLSENDLKKLEEVLLSPPVPNEKLKEAAQRYSDEVRQKHTPINDFIHEYKKQEEILKETVETKTEPLDDILNSNDVEEKERKLQEIIDKIEEEERIQKEKQDIIDNTIDLYNNESIQTMDDFVDDLVKNNSEIENGKWIDEEKIKQRDALVDIMRLDQEMGLYEDNVSDWDVTLMDGLEDEEPFFSEEEIENILQEEPTNEEEEQNFSTIEPETENIFQDNDEYLTQAIEEFNQQSIEEEFNDSNYEVITPLFEPIPLPTEPIKEETVQETTPIGQTEDLTDEKKN
jgi:Protein of unknown function (DUF1778)